MNFKLLLRFLALNPAYIKKNTLTRSKILRELRNARKLALVKAEKLNLGQIKFEIRELYFNKILLTRSFLTTAQARRSSDVFTLLGFDRFNNASTSRKLRWLLLLPIAALAAVYISFIGDMASVLALLSTWFGGPVDGSADIALTKLLIESATSDLDMGHLEQVLSDLVQYLKLFN